MASAPPKCSTQGAPLVSYKNTCGAPALKTSLKKCSHHQTTKVINAKIVSKPMDVCEGGMLAYMVSSPKLTQGAVSNFSDFYLHAKWVI